MKPWFTPEPSSPKHSALPNVLHIKFHQATRTKIIAFLVTIAAAAWTSDAFSQTITETYSTAGSYTFTVPQGVTSVTVQAWGAGGGGSGRRTSSDGGGGGGGGGFRGGILTVNAGNNISIVVGSGGNGGINNGNSGASGGYSEVSHALGTVRANGGAGGNANGNGGSGGGGSFTGVVNSQVSYGGGNGGNGDSDEGGAGGGGAGSTGSGSAGENGTASPPPDGGAGGSGGGGAGGNGGNDGNGSPGNAIGGGGGGGGDDNNSDGGNGADGQITISYTLAHPWTLYSRASGNWDTGSTWSLSGHSGGAVNVIPTADDIVLIGEGHTVTIPSGVAALAASVEIHDSGSSGTLVIGETSNTASSLTIGGNLTINASGTFRTGGNGDGTRTVIIAGDIINNGVLNLNYTNDTGVASFNGSATRTLSGSGSYVFQNFTINAGGNNLNINSNIRIDGILNFSANGLLVVDANSNITLGSGASVSGANSSRYIQLDGSSSENSNLIRITSASTTPWDFIYHVGTATGGYTPVDLPTITTTPDANATLAIKPMITGNMTGRLKRTFRFIVTGNNNGTTFSNGNFSYIDPSDMSSGDSDANYTTVWRFSSGTWTSIAGTVNTGPNTFTVTGGSSATASLNNGTYYYTIGSSLSAQRTWYSYQTGNFNNGSTWTLDPSGTTRDNSFNLYPGLGDEIHILNGLTVNVNVSGLNLNATTIHGGGTLNLGTTTGHNIGIITGTGLLRIKGTELPSAIYTDFVGTNGGTIEYYDVAGSLSTTQTTYNHLKMTNSTGAIVYKLIGTLNVNGNLDIGSSGSGTVTWQINDESNTQRTITLNGNLNVGTRGRITVGTGNEGSSSQHALSIYGNLTNSGIIKFYDPDDSELNENEYGLSYPASANDIHRNELQGNAVAVTFIGTNNQTVTCNNTTDFYRFIVNKGTSQQPVLTVNSSNTSYFRLFGPSNLAANVSGQTWEYTSNNALSIINGTLELTGSINIPNICIALTTATNVTNNGNHYFPIPRNGALWLNGADVTLKISDDAPDTNTGDGGKDGRIMISGLLRITAGTLNGGYSKGLGSQNGGSYLQEGGTVNCWQFRPKQDGTGVFSFKQTGGTLNVGFGYNPSGGKIDQYEEEYCRFDLRSPNCSFQMSGNAILNVAKPTNIYNTNASSPDKGGLLRIASAPGNYNVTGGTINLYMGPKTASDSYPGTINTTAPLYNLNIYEEAATTQTAQLIENDLVVLNNFAIHTGNNPSFQTNNLNVTVGGNFTISSNTTFNPGTGTITFNGTGSHKWTNNGTISALTNVVVDKVGTLTLDGTTFPDITGTTTGLMLKSGTLNDGNKTITVTGALSNSATHTGSGAIVYNRAGNSTIEGSNGTFGNLTIQTSNTVSTAGAQTITGTLRLTGAATKLSIGSHALTVLGYIYSNATTGVSFSAAKMIITSGLHNAGGLTRHGSAREADDDLVFPLGTGTTYTPNTIRVIVGTSGTHGTITVRPVASEHPNVTITGQSLRYYWRVTSAGYTDVTAVSHRDYIFNNTGLLAGTASQQDFYRQARFDRTGLKWAYKMATYDAEGTTELPNFQTDSGWQNNPGRQIDGEYTTGHAGAFDIVKVFYSKNSGSGPWNWMSPSAWTHNPDHVNDDPVEGPVTTSPCATCPVVIGDGASINHTITINANNVGCGTLEINAGSTLDCGVRTGLNFGVNTTGRGTLRIASPNFPAGDFLDFLGTNGGTVEWYAVAGSPNSPSGELTGSWTSYTNNNVNRGVNGGATYNNVSASSTIGTGSGALFTVVFSTRTNISSITVTSPGSGYSVGDRFTFNGNSFNTNGSGSATFEVTSANISVMNGYVIPSTGASPQSLTLDTYYNLTINPIAGKTIMLPANNLTVYKNWVQQGAGNVTNNGARSLSIKGDMTISSGTFGLSSGNTDITVAGNVSNSGVFTTTSSTHKLAVTGNLTNNGTVNFNNTGTVALKFEGSTNVTFGGSGTGGTTLHTVEVNKGSSALPTVTFNTGGTVTTTAATNGWLTLTNGTFDFANATTYTTSLSTNAYTIPSTAKLKVSGANVVVNTTSGDDDGYDLFLNGALEVAGGTVNVGNSTANTYNVDIEYVAAGTPSIIVSSGSLWVKSSVRRSTATVTGALVYTQSGGTVTVGGIDANNTRGVFEIDYNTGSSFSLTGTATLNVQRQNNATNCVTTYADVLINPAATSNVSATSTITVGLAGTPQTNFRVDIVPAIGNFTIQNGSAATNQRVWLYSNLTLKGALNIPVYATLNASCPTPDANVTLAGNFVCAGTYTGGTNTTVFNGTGAQSATLSTSTQFYNVTVSKSAGSTLTLEGSAPNAPALNNLNVLTGILNVSDGIGLTVNHDITTNSSQVGTGSIVVYSTAGTSNTINSNGGSFTNLTLGGTATSQAINVSGNLAINGALTFGANRYLNIASYQLSLGSAASVSGASSNAFIRTNGVASDKGVVKTWATGTSSFTYPIGTSTNYTPTAITLDVTTGGNVTVIPVNGAHLTYDTESGELILNYYWTVKRSSGLVASASSHTYSFPSSQLTGIGGTLLAGYLDLNGATLGWVTSGHGGTINTGVTPYRMEYTGGYANFPAHDPLKETSFDYSVGTINTLPNPIKPVYSRLGTYAVRAENGGGNWDDDQNWTTESDGDPDGSEFAFKSPKGVPVVILPGARINMNVDGRRAYKTTIEGLLYQGQANGTATTNHNLGKIDGTGTFRTPTNTFPAGDYSDFISSTGGTIEYEVTSDNSPLSMNSVNLTTAPNTVTYNNLAIAPGSSGVLTMTDDKTIINGNLAIPSGITLSNAHNRDIAIAGNWSNDGTFSPGTGAVIFDGSADKSVSGSTGFYSLTVSKTDANLNLTGSGTTTINGTLTMTDGHLIPDANHTLILSSTGTTSGGSEDSYISGKVQKVLNSGSITLPIGKISPGHYRPVSISNPSAADTWCAEYIGHNPGDDGYDPSIINSTSEIKSVSVFEYWNICRGSSASANLTLSYSTGSYTGSDIGDVTELRVARWHSDPDPAQRKWDTPPGVTGFSHSGDNVTGTITAINVTDFSPFTIGSINASSNTPVTWLAFSGRWVSDDVELVWSVSNEIDNDRFEVERSLNGVEFSTIAVVAGAGTYKGVSQYTFVDTEASSWKKYYYRIRQVDFDGKEDVTKTIVLMPEGTNSVRWLAYPNPSKQLDNVVIEDTQPEQNADIAITLMGADGRVILRVNGSLEYVNSRLSRAIVEATSGIYLLRVQQQGYTENIKLIHQ